MVSPPLDKKNLIPYTTPMQSIVLVGIFTDLLIKRKIPRRKLCEKYELSSRTISRYIDILTKTGIPVESHTGIGGGYVLPDDYKIDRQLFTKAENARIQESLQNTQFLFPDVLNAQILEKLEALQLENNAEAQISAAGETLIDLEFTHELYENITAWLGQKSVYEKHSTFCRARAKIRGQHGLASKILSFGAGVKVLAPAALKEEVLAVCKKILTNSSNNQ